jgi:hypothetical protein
MLTSSKLPCLAWVTQEGAEKEEHWTLQDRLEVDNLSAQLFALAVMDDSPNDFSEPNKIWTSQAEIQANFHPQSCEVHPSLNIVSNVCVRGHPSNSLLLFLFYSPTVDMHPPWSL